MQNYCDFFFSIFYLFCFTLQFIWFTIFYLLLLVFVFFFPSISQVCQASNQFGEQRIEIRLFVNSYVSVHILPQVQIVNSGGTAIFNCSTTGSAIDNIEWLHNGKPLQEDNVLTTGRDKWVSLLLWQNDIHTYIYSRNKNKKIKIKINFSLHNYLHTYTHTYICICIDTYVVVYRLILSMF